MKTVEMEIHLAKHFNIRTHLIVPNVSWGLSIHECDLLILSKAGYATEIEIKISKADLKKDKFKSHGHLSKKIKNFYYAVPEKIAIEYVEEHVPERAGIIVVNAKGRCKIVRKCIVNKDAIKFSEKDRYKMARLGALRIWNLKKNVVKKDKLIKELKDKASETQKDIK